MSLLFPIYFAGAMAIGLPILFHLIRRQPKGNVPFSSLMFLRPTPPRLTRRSRLDNWPLLLCRALALLLLAAAFTRPFFRSASSTEFASQGKRMVVAIDTSASMKRFGLWDDAMEVVEEVIGDLSPADEIAVVTFDTQPLVRFSFEQSRASSPADRAALIRSSIQETVPGWGATDLGVALPFCAELASTYETEDSAGASTQPASIVLISDLQSGSEMERLRSFSWPETLRLDVRQISANEPTNAWVRVLDSSPANSQQELGSAADEGDRIRVRVSNLSTSKDSRFELGWADSDGTPIDVQAIQVVAGQSQVVRLPLSEKPATSVRVWGDDVDFDNTQYFVSPEPRSFEVGMLENEPADLDPRDSLAYYLERTPFGDALRSVTLKRAKKASDLASDFRTMPLVVVTRALDDDETRRLEAYADSGGTVLYVVTDAEVQWRNTVALALASPSLVVEEADVTDYAMLSSIDFRHPLFATMAEPQFNDFTKVRFWSRRRLGGVTDEMKVVATFDDDSPAILQRSVGEGHVLVIATGWQPNESQLALSTKFIPLMLNLFAMSTPTSDQQRSYVVGDRVPFGGADSVTLKTSDRNARIVRESDESFVLEEPGIYQLDGEGEGGTFAVNVPENESRLEPIDTSEFERLGVLLADSTPEETKLAEERQLQDVELENSQRLWQWLLVGALVFLGGETLLVRRQT